jgi:hypothetical protein
MDVKTIWHLPGSPLSTGIYVENTIDFGDQENFRDIDFFMRLKTGIKNGGSRRPPTFYTDQVRPRDKDCDSARTLEIRVTILGDFWANFLRLLGNLGDCFLWAVF